MGGWVSVAWFAWCLATSILVGKFSTWLLTGMLPFEYVAMGSDCKQKLKQLFYFLCLTTAGSLGQFIFGSFNPDSFAVLTSHFGMLSVIHLSCLLKQSLDVTRCFVGHLQLFSCSLDCWFQLFWKYTSTFWQFQHVTSESAGSQQYTMTKHGLGSFQIHSPTRPGMGVVHHFFLAQAGVSLRSMNLANLVDADCCNWLDAEQIFCGHNECGTRCSTICFIGWGASQSFRWCCSSRQLGLRKNSPPHEKSLRSDFVSCHLWFPVHHLFCLAVWVDGLSFHGQLFPHVIWQCDSFHVEFCFGDWHAFSTIWLGIWSPSPVQNCV